VGAGRRAGLNGRAPRALRGPALLAALVLLGGCSPIYVARAGLAEYRILSARRPIPEVLRDSATSPDVRGKLSLTLEARRFAVDSLGLRAGDSYTTFTRLESDTLALVLSAAPVDRLAPKTWWFPIVGHIPYRAYFDEGNALDEQGDLEADGFDTYLRPTAAFSTLGWFSDPLLSTLLAFDHVALVETVLHELAHNHLYLAGHTRFNESYATFVGATGAIRFFCNRRGGGPDTVWCRRARARWADDRRFSDHIDGLVAELRALYAGTGIPEEELRRRREAIFQGARERFRRDVLPTLESKTFRAYRRTPLNNATLLARMRYYHRLGDFHAYLEARPGGLPGAIRDLSRDAPAADDPFDVLPTAGSEGEGGRPGPALRGSPGRGLPPGPGTRPRERPFR